MTRTELGHSFPSRMDWKLLTAVAALTLAGLLGVFLAPVIAKRRGFTDICTAIAAGVLLVIILVHVFPEALAMGPKFGSSLILAGFVGMMLLQQKVLKADPCCGHEHAKHTGLPSYLALAACSINDGLITQHEVVDHVEGSVLAAPLLWAMCGHKLTASFALVMLLKETSPGLRPSIRMLYMLVFVAITPVVVLAAANLAVLKAYMPYLVAGGAGALLYVISGGMIPRVEHLAQEGKNRVLIAFLCAVAVTLAVELPTAHSHG